MGSQYPAQRGALLHDDDFTLVAKYLAEYRGLVQYYLLAQDAFRLGRLRWVMQTSMLKTLAGKHRSTVTKMAAKYKTVIDTPTAPGPASRSVCRARRAGNHWSPASGHLLRRHQAAVLTDQAPIVASTKRNELIRRLASGGCEIRDSRTKIEVHDVRKLADLNRPDRPDRATWIHLMAKRRRKSLVVCRACQQDIQAGRASTTIRN